MKTKATRDARHAPSAPHPKNPRDKTHNVYPIEALLASPTYAKMTPTEKLVAMLKVKPLEALIAEGRVFTAKTFGERVGYSYDHVRRLCRAGKITPPPVLLGSGKTWKEYFFLPEHIDAVFSSKPV